MTVFVVEDGFVKFLFLATSIHRKIAKLAIIKVKVIVIVRLWLLRRPRRCSNDICTGPRLWWCICGIITRAAILSHQWEIGILNGRRMLSQRIHTRTLGRHVCHSGNSRTSWATNDGRQSRRKPRFAYDIGRPRKAIEIIIVCISVDSGDLLFQTIVHVVKKIVVVVLIAVVVWTVFGPTLSFLLLVFFFQKLFLDRRLHVRHVEAESRRIALQMSR